MTDKRCTKCGETKPRSEFGRHKGKKDDLRSRCKGCRTDGQRDYVARNRDKVRAYDRKYRSEHREPLREKCKRYRGRNQQEIYRRHQQWRAANPARAAVMGRARAAVYTSELEPQPCEICGDTTNIHAHHPDYSKPLDVRWLCSAHHRQLHVGLVELEGAA